MEGGGASAQRRWLEPWAPLGRQAQKPRGRARERLFQGLQQGRSEGEARPTGARRRRSQEGSADSCTEPRGIKDKGPETTGEVITSPGHSASALTLLPGRPSGTALLTGNLGE